MNDSSPQVAIRNLVLLTMMLDPSSGNTENVAEAALHLSYSAALTKAQSNLLTKYLHRILAVEETEDERGRRSKTSMRTDSSLLRFDVDDSTLKLATDLVSSTYTSKEAKENLHRVLLSPGRADARDVYLFSLHPRHRIAHIKWRDTGMVLPLGQPVDAFTEPNRSVMTLLCQS